MAWCQGILLSLYELGLRGWRPIFIRGFVFHRPLRVRAGSTLSEACLLKAGVLQGSILSVTLFAVAVNGVVGDVHPNPGPRNHCCKALYFNI